MNLNQCDLVRRLLGVMLRHNQCVIHHGDSTAADYQVHGIAESLEHFGMSIIQHPPRNVTLRKFCRGGEVRDSKECLERDMDIVDEVDLVIAGPWRNTKEVGGAWTMVSMAIVNNKQVAIIWPNGLTSVEGGDVFCSPSSLAKALSVWK